MFSEEALVKKESKNQSYMESIQKCHFQFALTVLSSGGLQACRDRSRWSDTIQRQQTGFLLLRLTLSRTTLVGHLSISVNGFESDFLAASVRKHHQT